VRDCDRILLQIRQENLRPSLPVLTSYVFALRNSSSDSSPDSSPSLVVAKVLQLLQIMNPCPPPITSPLHCPSALESSVLNQPPPSPSPSSSSSSSSSTMTETSHSHHSPSSSSSSSSSSPPDFVVSAGVDVTLPWLAAQAEGGSTHSRLVPLDAGGHALPLATVQFFNCCMQVCLQLHQLEQVVYIFRMMLWQQLSPDHMTYSLMVSTLRQAALRQKETREQQRNQLALMIETDQELGLVDEEQEFEKRFGHFRFDNEEEEQEEEDEENTDDDYDEDDGDYSDEEGEDEEEEDELEFSEGQSNPSGELLGLRLPNGPGRVGKADLLAAALAEAVRLSQGKAWLSPRTATGLDLAFFPYRPVGYTLKLWRAVLSRYAAAQQQE
jgi:hypothetical protein